MPDPASSAPEVRLPDRMDNDREPVDNEGLPPGFVPVCTFIKTPDGVIEYEHPAGEALRESEDDSDV